MKQTTQVKLRELVRKVEYARGTEDFEKWTLTLLSFLDGLLDGMESPNQI